MKYQLVNGKFYEVGALVLQSDNRGFNYGDGFFESIRVSNGKAPFIQLHWERLQRACKILGFEIANGFSLGTFNSYVVALARKNQEPNCRVKFLGFRSGSGRYLPTNSELGWCMTTMELENSHYQLNKKGLQVCESKSTTINPPPQSTFKSTNALPYVLASIEAKKKGFDDCFLNDAEGFLAEATSSNLFIVRNNMLQTPDLSNGGVAGVMRNVVLAVASEFGFKAKESLLKFEDVLAADECFLTNATRGIQWVGAIDKKRFFKKAAEKLTDGINQKFGLIS